MQPIIAPARKGYSYRNRKRHTAARRHAVTVGLILLSVAATAAALVALSR